MVRWHIYDEKTKLKDIVDYIIDIKYTKLSDMFTYKGLKIACMKSKNTVVFEELGIYYNFDDETA